MPTLAQKPDANCEFAALFDYPDDAASALSSDLLRVLDQTADARGMSVTLIIPFEDSQEEVFCAEAKPEAGVQAMPSLLKTASSPEFRQQYDALVRSRRAGLARDLGVREDRLMYLLHHGVVRIKSGVQGKTRAHIDYYSYMFKTDTLAEVAEARFGPGNLCTVCGTPIEIAAKRRVWMDHESSEINVRAPRICRDCNTAPLDVFTIWSCLHAMDTQTDAVLEADPRPLQVDPFELPMTEILRETPLWLLDHEEWSSFDSPDLGLSELKPGQGLVFTPCIPHRSRAGRSGDLRISIDMRFALLPRSPGSKR